MIEAALVIGAAILTASAWVRRGTPLISPPLHIRGPAAEHGHRGKWTAQVNTREGAEGPRLAVNMLDLAQHGSARKLVCLATLDPDDPDFDEQVAEAELLAIERVEAINRLERNLP